MTYAVDNLTVNGDYNTFVGVNGTSVYASQAAVDAAVPAVGAVYGAGYGNRGYGQTGIALATVSLGDIITSAQWTNMRNALAACSEHQAGAAAALIPPTTVLDPADVIQAHESSPPTSDPFDFNSSISLIDTNRFLINGAKGGTFVTTGSSVITRVGSWGSGSGTINCTFNFGFGTENAARYFFNSGGEIRINLSQPAGTPQDNDWRSSLVTRLGQVRLGYTSTTSTGTSGLTSSLGYYDLNDGFQTIIDGTNIGAGAYTANDVFITARRLTFVGTNGGNGVGVGIQIVLQDQHLNAFFDSVSGGTNASFSVFKATFLSGIVTASGTIIDGF